MTEMGATLATSLEAGAVLIVKENAVEVLKQSASLHSILNYHLTPKPVKTVRDTRTLAGSRGNSLFRGLSAGKGLKWALLASPSP